MGNFHDNNDEEVLIGGLMREIKILMFCQVL